MGLTTYKMLINGKWVSGSTGETFSRVNPANPREVLGKFQKGNKEDVDRAVDAAQDAFENWRLTPPPARGKILLKFSYLLEQEKEKLARTMTAEMGKVLKETRGDVQEAIDAAEYMAGEGRRLFGRTTTSELRNKFAMTVREPLGVVAAITPWNFPIAIPAWKITAALVCGNTVVMKPSSDTPICATRFMELLEMAGAPKGVVNMVTGPGGTVGSRLASHKKVRAVSFTGHRDTGAEIMKSAGVGKRVGMEMGSKNVTIVMDDADLKLALDGVIWGAFGTTGQRCTASSRVVVHKKVRQKFERMLVERSKKIAVGDGLEKKTEMGPLVNEAAREKVKSYVEIGKKEGARLVSGGSAPKRDGWFYRPTIFTDAESDMRICQEEIFGPVLSVIEAKDFEDAVDISNGVDYGLSSSIYTNRVQDTMRAIRDLQFGITYINSPTIGAEVHLPFGGSKSSGNGWKEVGWTGVQFFSEEKSVFVDYSGKLQKAQIDTDEKG
ncbi:MAG: aldehyde dehydrogenase family protein [Candidatus Aenigmarchaeota archaeon]|nr:aldehyde dehydrogenase family protein [Candidatus Aenigmarchaeota archaeon]